MNPYKSIYFIGAGGIGMSALLRYYLHQGVCVGGYDRVCTPLTKQLENEGADLHYEDNIELIGPEFKNPEQTLVVLTPAVPQDHSELSYFRENGFRIVKRAELLGIITAHARGLCVSGTHGKTTTSSMLAHLLHSSKIGCNAFLGGILKNYDSNLLLSKKSDLTVIEADEYDRSFHWLSPYMAIVTSTDPDHLDIYGTEEAYLESFAFFTSLVRPKGVLLIKKGLKLVPRPQLGVTTYHYSVNDGGDFYAKNVRIGNGTILFDFVTPKEIIKDIELGVPVSINIENGVAAMAIAWLNGVTPDEMREAMRTFAGAKRRFDFLIKRPDLVFIDDYAHHPDELKASISSVRALYPEKRITGIFQPHLYSRTKDFAPQFAEALSLLDELILLDIYPAREEPIPGVTSQIIFDEVKCLKKTLYSKELLLEKIKDCNFEVLITLGAGDIDMLLPKIKEQLLSPSE